MSTPVTIYSGDVKPTQAVVTKQGEQLVVLPAHPAFLPQLARPCSEYLTHPDNDEDMSIAVGTLAAPVEYSIKAPGGSDLYITEINFILGYGTTAYLYNFADSGAALTNGIRLYYTSIQGERDIGPPIKVNSDFLRVRREPLISDWQARNFDAINDWGYIGTIGVSEIVPPYGVKLDRGTNQRLTVAIRDDVSASADVFNMIARGFERFEL